MCECLVVEPTYLKNMLVKLGSSSPNHQLVFFLVWFFTVTWVDCFQLHVKRLGNNTQRIHAWYIYLHLVDFTHVGQYTTKHGSCGNVILAMLGRNICQENITVSSNPSFRDLKDHAHILLQRIFDHRCSQNEFRKWS